MSVDTTRLNNYKLPCRLTPFQHALYIHLIDWKWKHITKEPGVYNGREYDAVIPEEYKDQHYPLYRSIVDDIIHKHSFKPHRLFGHMASSQGACMNLFTPILKDEVIANQVLGKLLPDFKRLAVNKLETGFQFEYSDNSNPLNDHKGSIGTDVDLAVVYYNQKDELCLWFAEHKLAEKGFTSCGGYRSKKNLNQDWCRDTRLILNNSDKCFYSYGCSYRYWKVTREAGLFSEELMAESRVCPFVGGVNQLWRNLILAHAIKQQGIFKHYHFSVVHHPGNPDLENTISQFRNMLTDKSLFSVITSQEIISVASQIENQELRKWSAWYTDLYRTNTT
jgi:hypothetical protein